MNKVEVVTILKEIKGAYGNKFEINDHTPYVWHEYLGNHRFADVGKRLNDHISTKRYPPTIGHLLP